MKSDDGLRTVPLNAVATWHKSIGAAAINHINQFTSVTFAFNPMPGVPLGQVTDFIQQTADKIVPPTMKGTFQGEALTFRSTVSDLTVLMLVAVFVMYCILGILYESYLHPITVLSSLPVAFVRRAGDAVAVWSRGIVVRLHRHVHADGDREEERDHDRRLRLAANRRRPDRRAGDSRRQHGPFSGRSS